jgi:hypothetical protein
MKLLEHEWFIINVEVNNDFRRTDYLPFEDIRQDLRMELNVDRELRHIF